MSKTSPIMINQDLRAVNGKTIQFPNWSANNADEPLWGNLHIPDVYGAAHSVQQYPIGTVFRDDGRTFVYGKWSATTTLKTSGYMVCTVATYKDLSNAVISGAAGANTVIVNYGGACAVNKYAGGYMGIKGNNYRSFRIISNTVQDASNYVTFTLDGTFINACTTTDDVVLMEDPYREMRWYITLDSRPYIGATVNTVVASYYTWIQTWGVHMMMSAFGTWEGATGFQFGIAAYHGSVNALPTSTSGIVANTDVYGACQPIGVFAAGTDPSSPADVSIAYPVYLMVRP